MRKTQKVVIWMNGKPLETCRNREAAELTINHYKRQDAYEVSIGYALVQVVYEIKTVAETDEYFRNKITLPGATPA